MRNANFDPDDASRQMLATVPSIAAMRWCQPSLDYKEIGQLQHSLESGLAYQFKPAAFTGQENWLSEFRDRLDELVNNVNEGYALLDADNNASQILFEWTNDKCFVSGKAFAALENSVWWIGKGRVRLEQNLKVLNIAESTNY